MHAAAPAHAGSTLEALNGAIGIDLAARLVADFGGSRIYVAHSPRHGDRIANSIGPEAAAKVRRVFAGDRIFVPTDPEHGLRREKIVALRRKHRSISSIARAVHCSERFVYRVLADVRGK
jgi:hypothetical protein